MNNQAVAKTTGELTDITVTRADGSTVHLGKPNTLGFRVRLWLYKRKLKEQN